MDIFEVYSSMRKQALASQKGGTRASYRRCWGHALLLPAERDVAPEREMKLTQDAASESPSESHQSLPVLGRKKSDRQVFPTGFGETVADPTAENPFGFDICADWARIGPNNLFDL